MIHKRRLLIVLFLLIGIMPIRVGLAVNPQFWSTHTFADFQKGTLKGLSLSNDGHLSLSPKFDSVYDSDQALIWSGIVDSKGTLFVGTGHDGKVFKIDADGKSDLFFDASELDVLALALDSEKNLYVGTSPDGKVYKVNAAGKGSLFFDPEDKFIWDMAFDSKGNLFVATGNKGKIYKVAKDGKSELFFDSGQSNLVCLRIDSANNVIVGSDPNGYVFRISPEGKAFVLYDTGMREVHDLQLDVAGNIYLVAINAAGGGPATPEPKPVSSEVTPGEAVPMSLSVTATAERKGADEIPVLKGLVGRGAKALTGNLKSTIFRIAPDGTAEPLWSSDNETVYAILPKKDGRILFSTGTKGRVYSLDKSKEQFLLVETSEEQTTRLIPAGNDVLVCTSNLAKVYRLSGVPNTEGSYESDVRDTQSVSAWGSIQWKAVTPVATTLKIYTRTGNTRKPDKTWSDWSKVYSNADGELIASPKARYIQFKAVLSSTSQATPVLDQIIVPYLQQNFAPEVKSINILPPGVAYQRTAGVALPRVQTSSSDQGSAEASGAIEAIPPQPGMSIPPRRIFQKGAQSFSWEVEDRNGDDLCYSVYFRGEEEKGWKLLKKDVEEKFLTLESDTLADGKYLIRVVASDAPSNPASIALTGELTSAVFGIDNTPPLVQVLSQKAQDKTTLVRFNASDSTSMLRKAEVSVDGKDWTSVFSVDGIVDSKTEQFEVKTEHAENGEHTVALRVYDTNGNVGIGKAVVQVK